MARLLIIEDYDDTRTMLEKLFTHQGYECVGVQDGTRAIALFDESVRLQDPYDLILIDGAMPVITGYDVAKHIREWDEKVPILLITGDSRPIVELHAQHVGANKVMHKPLDPKRLVATAESLINKGRTANA